MLPKSVSRDEGSVLLDRLPGWLAALGGLGWFLWLGGGAVLSPTRIDWLTQGDWAMNLFGWLFLRQAPWGLPLGDMPNLFHPYGTRVSLTDGIPWVAVGLKPFSGWLPVNFQYTGAWLALCYALMGYFGSRLVAVASARAVPRVLGGVLLALAPVLAARFGHPALCAHWLLLAMLWLNLRDIPDERTAWRSLALAALFNGVAAGVHPYWVAMLLPLTAALAVRVARSRRLGGGRALAAVGGIALLDGLLFLLFGYLGGPGLGAEGFGDFSSDLVTLVNPMGWSRVMPELPARPRQGEGFGYLGLGAMLLGALAVASVAARWRVARALSWRRGLPALAVVLLMAVYALSWRVAWQGRQVVDLSALYAPFAAQTAAFRASGRFIWPLHYLLVGGALLLVVRLWRDRPWVSGVGLGLALAVQAYEWRADRSSLRWPVAFHRLQAPEWKEMKGHYRHLALFPPQIQWLCRYDEHLVNKLSYLAYREGLTFNSGNAARVPPQAVEDCRAALPSGGVDAETVYVVNPEHLTLFLQSGARCGVLEGLPVCVRDSRQDGFATALERQPLRLTQP
ncbi:DUF6311 domain-containing protein [Stigmatella aurantiaca]|uniref:Conserved uncharacterized protein n=1 Tax=Stigmatella aurantiaca (strain DW4/3-1) TaxID=378806 RepID=Q08XX7_STIAD|nr:DUF6311 domain-containing protein [Stigmatella aurantiaca]ADO75521.1 conserved uncharacterized protein [Stigmatella aurantiaca DW4/3-1]EAU65351.1 conserved hypothetical protein [Stigmatella aurantiaca DW4/3-1]